MDRSRPSRRATRPAAPQQQDAEIDGARISWRLIFDEGPHEPLLMLGPWRVTAARDCVRSVELQPTPASAGPTKRQSDAAPSQFSLPPSTIVFMFCRACM